MSDGDGVPNRGQSWMKTIYTNTYDVSVQICMGVEVVDELIVQVRG